MKAIDPSLLLLMNLSKVQSLLSRRFDRLSVHGIGFNDFMILYLLRQAPGEKMRRVDLADGIGLTSSGVTRMLVPMEKIGLIKREINGTIILVRAQVVQHKEICLTLFIAVQQRHCFRSLARISYYIIV